MISIPIIKVISFKIIRQVNHLSKYINISLSNIRPYTSLSLCSKFELYIEANLFYLD